MNQSNQSNDDLFGEVIHAYTRTQAIEDGELIDVSEVAREAGFKFPVAVTRNLWASWIEPDEKAKTYGQDVQGRLWDVLWMLLVAIRRSGDGEHITYQVLFQNGPGNRTRHTVTLWAICGPGDNAEPVITIMLPEDY